MRSVSKAILATVVLLGSAAAAELSLFNGKDLEGWKVPEGNIWWKVVDGTLVTENDPAKKGSILFTERSFEDFEVELEFKCGADVDSGVFLRDEKQQIQIGISGSLKRDMTGSPYIPGRGYPVEAEESPGKKGVKGLLKVDDWNQMKIRVVGPKYVVWLNGTQVLDFDSSKPSPGNDKKPGKIPAKGPIGLQLHPNKVMKVEFRKLVARDL